MAEIEVWIPDEVEEKFRLAARKVYGDSEDAIDKAASDAIKEWTERNG